MKYQDFIKKVDDIVQSINEKTVYENIFEEINGRKYEKLLTILPYKAKIKDFPNFYLYGNVGAGKTYNASKLKKIGYLVKWSEYYRDSYTDEKFNQIKKEAKNAEVLIIDDLGTSKFTKDFQLEVLFELIDYRYDLDKEKFKTIITTNLPMEILKKRMELVDPLQAARIIDRIKRFEKVYFDGPSLR